MFPDSITIFEIPLILELICESLSSKDCCTCRETCRLWDELFSPYAWRDVDLRSHSRRSVEARDYVRQKASWVRRLEISMLDTFFEAPSIFTRLHHLTCSANEADDYLYSGDAFFPAVATDLICCNPHLRSITIDITRLANKYIRQPILTALRALNNLQELELRIKATNNVTVIEALVRYCPDSLVGLAIRTKHSDTDAFWRPVTRLFTSNMTLPAWRTLPNLRRLTVEMDGSDEREESILFPLLRHSPKLYDLSIPYLWPGLDAQLVDILTEELCCPEISCLRLPRYQALSQDDIMRLFVRYPRLMELEFFCGVDYGPEVFRTLIKNSGSTLEVLRFADEEGPVHHRRHIINHIPMVLRHCPRLRVLESRRQEFAENVGVSLEKLCAALDLYLKQSDNLPTLDIIIRDFDDETHEYVDSESESEYDSSEEYDPDSGEKRCDFRYRKVCERLDWELERDWRKLEHEELWERELMKTLDFLLGLLDSHLNLHLRLHWASPCYSICPGYIGGDLTIPDEDTLEVCGTGVKVELLYDVAMVEAIVRHCPNTLTDLAVESSPSGALQVPVTGPTPGITFPAWRVLPNFCRLAMEGDEGQPEESILFSLLRHSSNLYDLSIPHHLPRLTSQLVDILTEESCCPEIYCLRLPRDQALPQKVILRLLEEYPDLVELEIFSDVDYGPEVFQSLIKNSGDTLEVLLFADEEGLVDDRRHILDHIQMVLENCPHLRVLESSPQPFAEIVGVLLEKLIETNWASDKLSTLDIIIRDIDEDDASCEGDSYDLAESSDTDED
ncbi:hypothetical protein BGX33_005485 [Mortierella sp. NVP41]|nr:hypothetical protein BGX33_005485 [Mortierella sp. NVP41]